MTTVSLATGPGMLAVYTVLICGTVARLTRLVTKDAITAPARTWIGRRASRGAVWRILDDLIGCPWCVSPYVAAAAAYVTIWYWDNRFILASLILCTASLVTGHLQSREPDDTAEDAQSVANLVEAGFTQESAVAAIKHADLDRLDVLAPVDEERAELLWYAGLLAWIMASPDDRSDVEGTAVHVWRVALDSAQHEQLQRFLPPELGPPEELPPWRLVE